MKVHREMFLCWLLGIGILMVTAGCGSDEPTVLQPGEPYQMTPDELALKEVIDQQRGEMDERR